MSFFNGTRTMAAILFLLLLKYEANPLPLLIDANSFSYFYCTSGQARAVPCCGVRTSFSCQFRLSASQSQALSSQVSRDFNPDEMLAMACLPCLSLPFY